jgi:nitrate reductase gamma subunit
MESWIEFGRGPLFRIAFALMLFGLLRALALAIYRFIEAHRNTADHQVAWKEVLRQTVAWLFPVRSLWKRRPFYSVLSILFHVGLIPVPLLLAAHVLLWRRSVGFAWPAMPQFLADWLTLLAIVTGLGLLLGRALHAGARSLSRFQDYLWPALLIVPFITGYCCVNLPLAPRTYQQLMLLHVYSANLIMALLPFTKMAHCILMPLSQAVTGVAWKFPAGAGDRVVETQGYSVPVWHAQARLAGTDAATQKGGRG